MVPTRHDFSLGEVVSIRVVGYLRRGDGDHKYVAVETARKERTLAELPEPERMMLFRLYPEVREHDAWFECAEAVAQLPK